MHIYYTLTHKCNLKCSHCIRGENTSSEMNYDDAINGLNKLVQAFPDSDIILTGGEPTIYKYFSNVLEYCLVNFRGKTVINSNGLTDFFQNDLFKYSRNNKLIVQISIDGNRIKHDNIRGTGNFHKAILLLKKMVKMNMMVFVSTTVNKYNYDTMLELCHVISDIGVTMWHVNSVMPFGRSGFEDCLDTKEWNKLVDKLIKNARVRLNIKKLYDFSQLKKMKDEEIEELSKKCVKNCGTGTKKIYIYPDMNVYGCTCLTDFKFGNLKENSLEEIMTSENANKLINYKLIESSPCNSCRYVKLCNGGCIGMSYRKFKMLGVGDCRCQIFLDNYNNSYE